MATLDIRRVLICQIQNNQQMAMIKQYVFFWNCLLELCWRNICLQNAYHKTRECSMDIIQVELCSSRYSSN